MKLKTTNSTFIIKVICAILFILFSFGFLYCYQADLIAMAQHVLSEGKTHYDKMVGAVLITGVLWLLQLGLQSMAAIPKRFYAVTFFPSLLILAVLTDISPDIDQGFSFGAWVWCFPLLLALYGIVYWLLIALHKAESKNLKRAFPGEMWPNFSLFFIMFLLVGIVSNHDDVFHYRMRVEQDLRQGDFRAAAMVGKQSAKTDSSLTMLRIYALSAQGELGEQLFEYPLVGRSDAMLPNGRSVKMMYASEGKFYCHLGVWIKQRLPIYSYLRFLKGRHLDGKAAHDYELCAYLLDKKLSKFAQALRKYYKIDGRLPKHYREALILLSHKTSDSDIQYHDDVMEADFADYKAMADKAASEQVRHATLADAYGRTYWFYYQYR